MIVCVGLGWLGSKPPEGIYVILARIFTIYYFAFFLVILPLLGIFEKTKPVPNSISESVLGAKTDRTMALRPRYFSHLHSNPFKGSRSPAREIRP